MHNIKSTGNCIIFIKAGKNCYYMNMALKPKTKAFADELISNPKSSQTDAYLKTHKTTNPLSARINASQLMAKPEVKIYLDKHVEKAKAKVVELIDSDKQDIALKASESILDRNLGKPLTRTNNSNLNINLEDLLANLQ